MTVPAPVYAMPVLGRYGLTHGLLAWARCRLWCEQNGATMIAPFWLKLRVGPYLRRERDKRNYFLLFHAGRAVSGLRRLRILASAERRDVLTEWPAVPSAGDRPVLLAFHNALKDNEKKSFAQVRGHAALLRRELLAITRARFRPATPTEPFLSAHVRMGDFAQVASVAADATNTRLPLDWFGDRIDALRAALGGPVRTLIFSDGDDAALAPLLARPNVARAPRQQSITDLLQMGQGAAVIASGSGFSVWGAFLGDAPRLAYPGQQIVPIHDDPTRDVESGFGEPIEAAFADHVRARLRG